MAKETARGGAPTKPVETPTEGAPKPSQAEAPPVEPQQVAKAAPAKPATPRFRVWPWGELHHNGVVFKAGEELPITEAEAEQIGPTAERFEG